MIAKRIAVTIGAMALALAATASTGVAFAGSNDNSSATVDGVEPVTAYVGCDTGYFCLYTEENYGGKVFRLYNCKEYHLHNWNGKGSYQNMNTGGAHALIQGKNYNTLVDTYPVDADGDGSYHARSGSYNFTPAWHVKAC